MPLKKLLIDYPYPYEKPPADLKVPREELRAASGIVYGTLRFDHALRGERGMRATLSLRYEFVRRLILCALGSA